MTARLPPLTLTQKGENGVSILTFYDVKRIEVFQPVDNRKMGDLISVTDSVIMGREAVQATQDNLQALQAWQLKVSKLCG
jgi:hypothetical protein